MGRGLEIAAVRERLRGGRVVTLTGPGGCGKTRLALRVATLADGSFGDGARLVELASLTDPALVPALVAEALGVPERDAADPMAGVVRARAARELLIVLDNCEHVLGSAGRAVVMLAEQCRRVRILTTSRERLDVPGESVFPVPLAIELAAARGRRRARSEPGPVRPGRSGARGAGTGSAGHGGLPGWRPGRRGAARHARGRAGPDGGGPGGARPRTDRPGGAAIAGAGIQPATVAALDEAVNVLAAHPDRFTETVVRQLRAQLFATLGQFDRAETEVGLCWAAGRSGAHRFVEFAGPGAEARLASARGDAAAAASALRRAADGGRRVGSVMFVPADLAALA